MWYLSSGWKIFQVVLPSMTPWVVEAVWVLLVLKECFSCSGKVLRQFRLFRLFGVCRLFWLFRLFWFVWVVWVLWFLWWFMLFTCFFLVLVVQVACAVNIAEVVLFMPLWLFGLL